MNDTDTSVPSMIRRMKARGCGFLFFLFTLVLGAAFGGGLGLFAWRMEKAKAQIETLDQFRPKIGSKVYADRGAALLGEFNVENRQLIRLSEIPLILQKAIVAAEDALFYEHKGVRPDAFVSVALGAMRTGRVRGASTITMQLVRNAEEATGVSKARTASRKLQEMIVALQVEREFTKDEILELYLNQVFLGGSAHGVEAASLFYFGKPCKRVTLEEAATLASILPSPNAYRPDLHPERAQTQRNLVLARMLEHGFITQEEYERARATRVADYTLSPEERAAWAATAGYTTPNKFKHPYFVREMKYRGLLDNRFTDEQLIENGYEIITTLDTRLQKAAEEALFAQLKAFDERKLKALQRAGREEEFVPVQGALVCMDNRPEYAGYVRALVGGRNWEEEQFNMATQAARQPGSSVKPFIWAAALQNGKKRFLNPTTVVEDAPFVKVGTNGQIWAPRNFSGDYAGPMQIRLALEKSTNTVSLRLADSYAGIAAVKAMLQNVGFKIPIPADAGLTIALGSHAVTPLEQCAAYATIARGGMYTEPIFIESIKDRDGLEIYHSEIKSERKMEESVAYVMLHMMRGVCESPWGTGGRTSALKRPRAGKTGTSNDARDVWFCGFTPEYTCVVWIGYKDNRPLGSGADYTGGRLAVPVWTNFMIKALEGQPVRDFEIPEGAVEWHTVTRQTSRGYQANFKEAFVPGTYRAPDPPSSEQDLDSIERQMEQKMLGATSAPTSPSGESTF